MNVRIFAFVLAAVFTATLIGAPVGAQGAVRVFVDGEPVVFDQPPLIEGSRVLVPLRGIFEKMGAMVEWRSVTRTVLAARGNTLVELQIGSRIAKVNDRPITLDVPAMIIRGRTLVPLRFISESLGARVDWNPETRTVLISSSGQAAPPPPPVAQPPAQPTSSIRGVITNVVLAQSAQDQPRVTIESGNIATTIRITTETAITRVETASGVGGSVGVAALRPGDDAEVTLQGDVAIRLRATYTTTVGKIEAIAKASRTLVMTDGRAIKYASTITVLAPSGQPAQGGVDALRTGQIVELRLNPTTKEAWQANITEATQMSQPNQMTLNVTRPRAGQTVSNPIRVAGTTVAGSRVDIAVTWFLGFQVGRTSVNARADGEFNVQVPVTVVAPNTPYLITVTAIHPQLGQEQRQFTVLVGNGQ